ncbi:MAG TPA: methylmalonyl Co-A mutase-associated GTPase MeaB, partial [Polyangiales bacterium]
DKTRMARLAIDPRAFIRPSPASGTLGGVAAKTRETMLLCEAAGYDVVLVETVGVGQSETMVAEMVDFYLVLMLAGAGDELQGIKRGILELADMIAVNKADGDNLAHAERARREYEGALHLMHAHKDGWQVPVVKCSGTSGQGLQELWANIERHRSEGLASGLLEARRKEQQLRWMWQMVEEEVLATLHANPAVQQLVPELTRALRANEVTATLAAHQILGAFGLKG